MLQGLGLHRQLQLHNREALTRSQPHHQGARAQADAVVQGVLVRMDSAHVEQVDVRELVALPVKAAPIAVPLDRQIRLKFREAYLASLFLSQALFPVFPFVKLSTKFSVMGILY